jgi:hypothetical protein
LQCLGLAPAAVLRQRKNGPPALPQGLSDGQPHGLGGYLTVLACRQHGLEAVLLGPAVELLEPAHFASSREPTIEILERVAPPERQCARKGRYGPIGFIGRRELSGTLDEVLESLDIELGTIQGQLVSTRNRSYSLGTHRLAQAGNAYLYLLGPR